MKKQSQKESSIVRQTIILLRQNGWWVYKVHGAGWSRAGIPDLICLKQGITIWVEMKQPGNSTSKIQEVVMKELSDHGATVMVMVDPMETLRVAEEILRFENQLS